MQAAPTSACPVASISATSDLNRGTFGIRLNFSRDYKERAFLCAKITGSATRDTTTVAITNIRPSSRSPHKASFARVLEEERYCLLSCDLATEDGREARGWLATFIVEGTWTFDPLEISTRDKSSTSKRARGEKSENEHKSEQEGSPETLPKVRQGPNGEPQGPPPAFPERRKAYSSNKTHEIRFAMIRYLLVDYPLLRCDERFKVFHGNLRSWLPNILHFASRLQHYVGNPRTTPLASLAPEQRASASTRRPDEKLSEDACIYLSAQEVLALEEEYDLVGLLTMVDADKCLVLKPHSVSALLSAAIVQIIDRLNLAHPMPLNFEVPTMSAALHSAVRTAAQHTACGRWEEALEALNLDDAKDRAVMADHIAVLTLRAEALSNLTNQKTRREALDCARRVVDMLPPGCAGARGEAIHNLGVVLARTAESDAELEEAEAHMQRARNLVSPAKTHQCVINSNLALLSVVKQDGAAESLDAAERVLRKGMRCESPTVALTMLWNLVEVVLAQNQPHSRQAAYDLASTAEDLVSLLPREEAKYHRQRATEIQAAVPEDEPSGPPQQAAYRNSSALAMSSRSNKGENGNLQAKDIDEDLMTVCEEIASLRQAENYNDGAYRAREVLRTANRRSPHAATILEELAQCLAHCKDVEAIECATEALNLRKTLHGNRDARTQHSLEVKLVVFLRLDRAKDAMRFAWELVQQSSGEAKYKADFALALLRTHRSPETEDLYRDLSAIRANNHEIIAQMQLLASTDSRIDSLLKLAWTKFLQGQFSEANNLLAAAEAPQGPDRERWLRSAQQCKELSDFMLQQSAP